MLAYHQVTIPNLQRRMRTPPFWFHAKWKPKLSRDRINIEDTTHQFQVGEIIDLDVRVQDKQEFFRLLLEHNPLISRDQDEQMPDSSTMETISFLQLRAMTDAADDEQTKGEPIVNDSDREELASLHQSLQTICFKPWIGLNDDWTVLPTMHPMASIALQVSKANKLESKCVHIYTDGSYAKGLATWAFVVISEEKVNGCSQYVIK